MTQVDIGKPPVLDGRTGEVITTVVDGAEAVVDTTPAPPQEVRLIDVPLETLNHDFTKLWYEREEKLAEKKEITSALNAEIKALTARINPIVAEMKRRDAEVTDVLQPSMFDDEVRAGLDAFEDDNGGTESEEA